MEALPRMPMLAFELKTTTEIVEFTSALSTYIYEHYHEDPAKYAKECQEMEQLRMTAVDVSRDFMGCSVLKKYYAQLHFLQSRFPMSQGDVLALPFTWEDIYNGRQVSHSDIQFEQACALYNIGALHSILGALDNRQSPEGMKVSCTHFQCAAWAFSHLRDSYSSAYSPDMSRDVLTFQLNLMLAQAQECILEKSMTDNRKCTITAKVAGQIVEYYELAMKSLDTAYSSGSVGSRRFKDWHKRVELKVAFHQCIMYFYQGQQSEEQQLWGQRLTYFKAALDRLNHATALAKNEEEDIEEALKFTLDVVGGKYNSAKKDNDFIYHEKVPELETLPEIKGASLVKGIPFNYKDPEVAGQDIFHRLVPMEAHEASSLYSEEKASLLRRVVDKIEDKNTELSQFLSSLQIDQSMLTLEPERLPQTIVEKCAAISVRPGAIKQLVESMTALSNVSTDVESCLQDIQEMMDADGEEEKTFQSQFGKRSDNVVLEEIRKECAKYQEGLTKASQSNIELHKAMTTHISNLQLLNGPLEQLEATVPNFSNDISPEDMATIQELQRLCQKVDEMQSQRTTFEQQLRTELQNDDITNDLVTSQDTSQQALFQERLKKHDGTVSLLEKNMQAQDNILRALTETNAVYANLRRHWSETKVRREDMIAGLIHSYDVYEDLLAKSKKGTDFYKKLEQNVNHLVERTKGVCKINREERQQISGRHAGASMKTSPSGGTSAAPTLPAVMPAAPGGAPTLKDYLPFMKPKTFGPKPGATPAAAVNPAAAMNPGVAAGVPISNVSPMHSPSYHPAAVSSQNVTPAISGGPSSGTTAPVRMVQYEDPNYPLPPNYQAVVQHKAGQASSTAAAPMPVTRHEAAHTVDTIHGPIASPTEAPTHMPYTSTAGIVAGQPMSQHSMAYPPGVVPGSYSTASGGATGAQYQNQPTGVAAGYRQQPAGYQNYQTPQHSVPSQVNAAPTPVSAGGASMNYPAGSLYNQPQNPAASQYSQPPTQAGYPQSAQPPQVYNKANVSSPQSPMYLTQPTVTTPVSAAPTAHGYNPTQSGFASGPYNQTQYQSQTYPSAQSYSQGHYPQPTTTQAYTNMAAGYGQQAASQQNPQGQVQGHSGQGYSTGQPLPAANPQTSQTYSGSYAAAQGYPQQTNHNIGQKPVASTAQNSYPQQGTSATQASYMSAHSGYPQQATLPAAQAAYPQQATLPAAQAAYPQQATLPAAQAAYPQQATLPATQAAYLQQATLPAAQAAYPQQATLPAAQAAYPQQATPPAAQSAYPQQASSSSSQSAFTPQVANNQSAYSQAGMASAARGYAQKSATQNSYPQQGQTAAQAAYSAQPSNQASYPPQQMTTAGYPRQPSPQTSYQSPYPQNSYQQPAAGQTALQPNSTNYAPQNAAQTGYNQQNQHAGYNQSNVAQTGYSQQKQGQTGYNQQNQAQTGYRQQNSSLAGYNQSGYTETNVPQSGYNHQNPTQAGFNQQKAAQTGYNQKNTALPSSGQSTGVGFTQSTSQNSYQQPAGYSQQQYPYTQASTQPPTQPGYTQASQPPTAKSHPPGQPYNPQQAYGQAAQAPYQPYATPSTAAATVATTSSTAAYSSNAQTMQNAYNNTAASSYNQQVYAQPGSAKPSASGTQYPPGGQYGSYPNNQTPSSSTATSYPAGSYNVTGYQATNSVTPQQQQQQGAYSQYVAPQTYPGVTNQTPPSGYGAPTTPAGPVPEPTPNLPSPLQPIPADTPTRSVSPASSRGSCSPAPTKTSSVSSDAPGTGRHAPETTSPTNSQHSTPTHGNSSNNAAIPAESGRSAWKKTKSDPYMDKDHLDRFVVETEKFEKMVESLTKKKLSTPSSLEMQWREMNECQDSFSRSQSMAIARCYPLKNRDLDIMPYDATRVVLTASKDDYINASSIGELSCGTPQIIATQAPLPATMSDFWQMVYEQGSEVIVMLAREGELGKHKIHIYWPQEKSQPVHHGPFTISLQSVRHKACWIERILNVTHVQTRQFRTVVHLQFLNWPPKGAPETPGQLLQFIHEVESFYVQQRNLNRPVVVLCSDGAGRCGTFCTIMAGVHQISEGAFTVDIPNLVKQLRCKRKYMVQDVEQLQYCYEAVLYHCQDILIKRGILTNKASFGDRLPGPGEKGHQRKPSEDFIMGTSSNLSVIQNSVDKMTKKTTPATSPDNMSNVAPPQSPSHSLNGNVRPVESPTGSMENGAALGNLCLHDNADSASSAPLSIPTSPAHSSVSDSLPPQANIPESSSSLDNLPSSLADLQDPQTFSLDMSSPGRKRMSKSGFINKTSSLADSSSDPTDPFCGLDPLWTMKKPDGQDS